MHIISGTSNEPLAKKIANYLHVQLIKRQISYLNGNEIYVQIQDTNLKGKDIFILQSFSNNANNHIMELTILADTLKHLAAKNITAIIPYFGYSRQDRAVEEGESAFFKCLVQLLKCSGIKKIITLDLHNPSTTNNCPLTITDLPTTNIFTKIVKDKKNSIIVAPDRGATHRAKSLADSLGIKFLVANKKRKGPKHIQILNIPNIKLIEGKDCYIIDDIIAGGNTVCSTANLLKSAKPKSIKALVSHGLFGTNTIHNIMHSPIEKIYITNSITSDINCSKLNVLDVSSIICNYLKERKRI